MMPSNPVPNLIIGQARVTLRPPEALLDAMLGFRHPGQLLQDARVRVREIIVMFVCSSACSSRGTTALLGAFAPRFGAGPDPSFDRFDDQGPFGPSRTSILVQAFRQRLAPAIQPRERNLGMWSRPEYPGGGASKSRTNMFEGTANRYCSFRVRKSRRNPELRPISSSPAIQACGNRL